MKILMLNPPFLERFSRSQRSPAVTKGGTFYYPLWLAYATGTLDREFENVKFIDAPAERRSTDDVISFVKYFNPELVVIDTSTPSIYNDVKVAGAIKEVSSDCFIALVGTHPSAVPDDTLNLDKRVDAVARGEYDYTIRDLARVLSKKDDIVSVDGISFRRGDRIFHNPDRKLIENLDELPFMAEVVKRHLNIKNYYFAPADYPMIQIITGRGCPAKCFFCVYPQTFHSRRYRFRSPENVVREFEYIAENLPEIKEIGIEDDTFTAKFKRCETICNLLVERKIKTKWYCNVRANLNYALLKKMKEAGCRLLTVGFESGNQQVLDNMNKGLKLETAREFVESAKMAKILIHGCIMVGNPGETKETAEESFRFAKELKCDSMQFYPLFVYPGTEAYEWAKKNGYLLTEDYSKWLTDCGSHNCTISLPGLSRDEIVDFCEKAYKSYHFNPSYILMKLFQMLRYPSEGRRTIRSALNFIRYLYRDYKTRNGKSSLNYDSKNLI